MTKQLSAEDVRHNLRAQLAEFRFLRTPFREKDIGNPRNPALEVMSVSFVPDEMRPKPVRPTKVVGANLPEVVKFPRDQALSVHFVERDVTSRILPATSLRMRPVPNRAYDVVVAWQYGKDRLSREGRALFLGEINDPAVYTPPPARNGFIPVTTPLFPSLNRHTAKFEGTAWHPTGKIMILPTEFAEKLPPGAWGKPADFHAVEYHAKIVLLPVEAAGKEAALARYVAQEVELTEEQFLFNGQAYSITEELDRERVELPDLSSMTRKSFDGARKTAYKRLHPDKLGTDAPEQLKNMRQMKFSKIMAAFERLEEIYFVSTQEPDEDASHMEVVAAGIKA